jgi:hypothetical protein
MAFHTGSLEGYFSSVAEICEDRLVVLLEQAAAKLAEARECRELARTIENKRAASLLVALAEELERRAQQLTARTELAFG